MQARQPAVKKLFGIIAKHKKLCDAKLEGPNLKASLIIQNPLKT